MGDDEVVESLEDASTADADWCAKAEAGIKKGCDASEKAVEDAVKAGAMTRAEADKRLADIKAGCAKATESVEAQCKDDEVVESLEDASTADADWCAKAEAGIKKGCDASE